MEATRDLSDIRRQLRDATHAEHARLNRHPLLLGLTRPAYSLASYCLVLRAYHFFYQRLEAAIDAALAAGLSRFAYAPRRKLPWLVEDLRHFGIDPAVDRIAAGILLPAPALTDEGRLLGALYTIEGSSLGGMVIVRHLAANLGLDASRGARFFTGYGPQVMPLWAQFEAFLSDNLRDAEARQGALLAAKSTFAMMETVLDEYLVRSQSV